jgi:hypothetical protein
LRFICCVCAKTIFSLILPSDYLVDEGAELSSTTELLLDRTHEQALVDLMTPSLVLLINLLQILHVICYVLFLVWLSMQLPQAAHINILGCIHLCREQRNNIETKNFLLLFCGYTEKSGIQITFYA